MAVRRFPLGNARELGIICMSFNGGIPFNFDVAARFNSEREREGESSSALISSLFLVLNLHFISTIIAIHARVRAIFVNGIAHPRNRIGS